MGQTETATTGMSLSEYKSLCTHRYLHTTRKYHKIISVFKYLHFADISSQDSRHTKGRDDIFLLSDFVNNGMDSCGIISWIAVVSLLLKNNCTQHTSISLYFDFAAFTSTNAETLRADSDGSSPESKSRTRESGAYLFSYKLFLSPCNYVFLVNFLSVQRNYSMLTVFTQIILIA